MQVKLLKHDIVLKVKSYDKKTRRVIVKLYGTLCSFREDEYEVIEDNKEYLDKLKDLK